MTRWTRLTWEWPAEHDWPEYDPLNTTGLSMTRWTRLVWVWLAEHDWPEYDPLITTYLSMTRWTRLTWVWLTEHDWPEYDPLNTTGLSMIRWTRLTWVWPAEHDWPEYDPLNTTDQLQDSTDPMCSLQIKYNRLNTTVHHPDHNDPLNTTLQPPYSALPRWTPLSSLQIKYNRLNTTVHHPDHNDPLNTTLQPPYSALPRWTPLSSLQTPRTDPMTTKRTLRDLSCCLQPSECWFNGGPASPTLGRRYTSTQTMRQRASTWTPHPSSSLLMWHAPLNGSPTRAAHYCGGRRRMKNIRLDLAGSDLGEIGQLSAIGELQNLAQVSHR